VTDVDTLILATGAVKHGVQAIHEALETRQALKNSD